MGELDKKQRGFMVKQADELAKQRFGERGRKMPVDQWRASKQKEQELLMEYAENLSYQAVSRCPICQQVLELPIDTQGLDGAWWWNLCPVELPPPLACDHFQVFLGAMDFGGRTPTEVTRTVIAGPSRPFVIDRLLSMKGVTAVISTVRIDPGYRGYVVAYFSSEPINQSDLHQEWRRDSYPLFNADGEPVASGQKLDFWNFHLEDWSGTGKLYFIAPRDSGLELLESMPEAYRQSLDIDPLQQVTDGQIRLLEPPTGGETGLYDTVD